MSFKALQWAAIVVLPNGGPAAKATLCVLAWHHNHKTGRCDPSIETMAIEIGASENTVRAALEALERPGVIAIVRGTNRTHQFKLNIGWGIPAFSAEPRGSKSEPLKRPRGVQSTNPKTAVAGVQNLNRRGSESEPESWKEPGKGVAPTAPSKARRAARRTTDHDSKDQKSSPIATRERGLGGPPAHGSSGGGREARQGRPSRTSRDAMEELVRDVNKAKSHVLH